MGERKVLINYIPPDFDPSIIPKSKRDKNKLVEVRTMLPFSMKCLTCGEYMYRGKKFNSRKEMVEGDTYLGIRKFRFYIKCSFCSNEIVFKTDPKNADYEMESGATRNFEMWRDNEAEESEESKLRLEEEKVDAMKALENRTLDSKVEMDVLDALDEIKAINQRHERVNTEALLAIHAAVNNNSGSNNSTSLLSKEEEEALIKSIKFKNSGSKRGTHLAASDSENDEDEGEGKLSELRAAGKRPLEGGSGGGILSEMKRQLVRETTTTTSSILPVVISKKKKRTVEPAKGEKEGRLAPPTEITTAAPPAGLSGLMAYGNSDSD